MPSVTTLADLRGQCRLALASTSDWADATLDKWIADAIRIYSARFPRTWKYTLTLATGTQSYALPGLHGLIDVLRVEYPAGQTPPEFVYPADPDGPAFQDGDCAYAITAPADSTAIESDTGSGSILFADTVTTGETAVITYNGCHAIPVAADDDAQITVPLAHWEALIAFVDFRAHWELETDEAATISTVSVVLAQLGENARRAWNRYKELMDYYAASDSRSHVIAWQMPY